MNRSTLLLGLIGLAILSGGAWYLSHHSIPYLSGVQKLGAGAPLAGSNTQIEVLEEAQPVTTSTENLSSNTTIAAPTQPARIIPPAVFDKTTAQLGTTISMLLSTWQQGGPLVRQLANDAANLADATGQPVVADAAAGLRSSTPREGPATINLLLVEVAQALTLSPPDDLPVDTATAEAQKSWLRKQLEQLVNIRSTPNTQNSWSTSLAAAQLLIARGLVVDASEALNSSPLSSDSRLDTLRADIKANLSQTGKLNNLVTAYTSTFTVNPAAE